MDNFGTNFRAQKADVHAFSMIPRAEIPRSSFRMQHQHKKTMEASALDVIYVQEVLPGDTFNVSMTAFVRMSTPIVPIMDNIDLETWFFFVPCRLTWSHWVNFMGEQPSTPSDSISFTIPQIVSPVGGFPQDSIWDSMGVGLAGQVAGGNTVSVNALPFRAYNLIFNQWFRDENLDNAFGTGASGTVGDIGDGPDPYTNYNLQVVRKRHDYFTSCLPWTQKGGVAVTLPLGTSATVRTSSTDFVTGANAAGGVKWRGSIGGALPNAVQFGSNSGGYGGYNATSFTGFVDTLYPSNLYADLSTATAATINQIRLAFQTQRLLERDARGGTRYTEIIRSHFGVMSPDMRLQRPEYLGGGKQAVTISPVPQTTATGLTGGSSPLGTLAAVGTAVAHNHGFRQSFTEHGYILGLAAFRRDQVYQQGMRRLWTRSTRYDFYFPVFAYLGEQAVRNDEIYVTGSTATDPQAFGYQERWAEYRYHPSRTSWLFRSTNTTPIDYWHTAIKFTTAPALNGSFIVDDSSITLQRNLVLGVSGVAQQFLCDFFFDERCARPMPMYSVPGLIDHF